MEAITDEDGNNLYEDLVSLNEFFVNNNMEEQDLEEMSRYFLKDMVEKGRLTARNFEQIYDLIPNSAYFTFNVSSDKEDIEKTTEVRYYKTNIQDPNTVMRAALAIVADAIDQDIVYEVNEEVQGSKPSDYQFYYDYDVIEPGFNIEISTERQKDNLVGFFPKYFPDDEYLKFNFNSNDENLFCVFSALFKQSDELYQRCGLEKPTKDNEKDFYLDLIANCGLNQEYSFAITSNYVAQAYRQFAKTYSLSLNITYYYLKKSENKNLNIDNLTHKTLKFPDLKKDLYFPKILEPLKLTVAKVENHLFNINKGTSKRSHAIMYLQNIVNIYDTLKDKCVGNNMKTISKMSREHAKEFTLKQKERLENPDLLLLNANVNDLAKLETPEADSFFSSLYFSEEDKEELKTPINIKYVPFVFDYETVLNKNGEHCIYSYVIKKVGTLDSEFFFNKNPFEKLANKNNPVLKIFKFVIDNTQKDERPILLAHNGAKFDNLLTLKIAAETYGVQGFREITAGPNNDILLSLDITYTYKRDRCVSYDCKVISFRDSYKILDCKASDIPANYGTTSFKLPYSYKFYNEYFKVQEDETLNDKQKEYRMRKFSKEYEFDEEFKKKYDIIVNGTATQLIDLAGKAAIDLSEYRKLLKKKNVYYLPDEYCKIYNKYDVIVVEEGLLKMQDYIRSLHSKDSIKKLIDENSNGLTQDKIKELKDKVDALEFPLSCTENLNIFTYRSLASLVFDIAKKSGVFDNIAVLYGNLKRFIQLSVVGGRVMKNPREEMNDYRSKHYDFFESLIGKDRTDELDEEIIQKAMEDSIIDNDAVSLYPSAISLCKMPAGIPKIYNLTESDQKDIHLIPKLLKSGRTFFCLDIETRKDLEFPILSEKVDGVRHFRNGKFNKIVIGDVALSNVLNYQDAVITRVYTIVRFKETCDRFAKFIKTLFTLRLIFKAIKLQCQNTIKLIMNSAYGRTILKESAYKKEYKRLKTKDDKDAFIRYLNDNFYYMKPEVQKIGNFIKVQKRNLAENPSGYPHVGSHILEVSKHLMNKMFNKIYEPERTTFPCNGKGLGLSVYYTDTDSIHVQAKSLKHVGDMIGEDMTKFHSDFSEVGYRAPCSKEIISGVGAKTPGLFAIRSIFVMKKCYYDKIFCINNETNKYALVEHKRVKGISAKFMNEDRYERLLKGESMECDLCDYRDMILRKTKKGSLINLTSFKRVISKVE